MPPKRAKKQPRREAKDDDGVDFKGLAKYTDDAIVVLIVLAWITAQFISGLMSVSVEIPEWVFAAALSYGLGRYVGAPIKRQLG